MNGALPPPGQGAVLARLVALGRRAGLSPEQTLLHVIDGAPDEAPSASWAPASPGTVLTTPARPGEVRDALVAEVPIAPAPVVEEPVATAEAEVGSSVTTRPTAQVGQSAAEALTKRARILDLFDKTDLTVAQIGERVGTTAQAVHAFLTFKRLDPRVVSGRARRRAGGRHPDDDIPAAPTAVSSSAVVPAVPEPLDEAGAPDGDGGAPPPAPPEPVGGGAEEFGRDLVADLVETAAETEPEGAPEPVLAIEGDGIVGPAGRLKGFPLINRILAALADGSRRRLDEVAAAAEARNALAVQAVLQQWRPDLARIGVTLDLAGGARLRRSAP